jgi:hypothetical protein
MFLAKNKLKIIFLIKIIKSHDFPAATLTGFWVVQTMRYLLIQAMYKFFFKMFGVDNKFNKFAHSVEFFLKKIKVHN